MKPPGVARVFGSWISLWASLLVWHGPGATAGTPPPGSLDATFTTQIERLDGAGNTSPGAVHTLLVLDQDDILVGGEFQRVNGRPVHHLARLHADGSLDSTFTAKIDPAGVIHAVVPSSDGRLWIGGSFKQIDGQRRVGLARLMADGALDPSFELIPELAGEVHALLPVASAAGVSLIVGGHYECLDPLRARWIRHLGRWILGGGWDAAFHFDLGLPPAPFVDATDVTRVILQEGTRMRIVLRPPLAPAGNAALWGLNAAGDWDPDYTQIYRTSHPDLIAVPLGNDRLLLSHGWDAGGASPVLHLLRSDGEIDPAFPRWMAQLHAGITEPDGHVVFAARFEFDPANADTTLFRWRTDGTLDPAFGRDTQFDRPPTLLALQSDGKILVAGAFESINNTPHRAIGRCHGGHAVGPRIVEAPRTRTAVAGEEVVLSVVADGSEPLAYQWRNAGRDLDGETNTSLALAQVRGNEARTYDVRVSNLVGVTTSAVARINVLAPTTIVTPPANAVFQLGAEIGFNVFANGATPLTYQWIHDGQPIPQATNASIVVGPVALPDLGTYSVVVSGPGGTVTSPPAFLKLRGTQPGDIDPSFAPGTGVAGTVYAIRPLSDGRVAVGGSFTQIAGVHLEHLAILSTNGTPEAGFVPRVPSNLRVASIDVQRDGRIVVGGRIDSPLGSEGYLGVVSTDGHAVSEARIPTLITCVRVQPDDRVVVGGAFRWVASPTHIYTNVIRLLPNLDWDPSFTTNGSPNGYVTCVRLDAQGRLLVAGNFTGILRHRRMAIARLFPDGTVDTSFDAGEFLDPSGVATVYDLASSPDDQAWYVCGNFESISGHPARGVARLTSQGQPDTTFAFSMPGTAHEQARVVTVQSNGYPVLGGAFDANRSGGISAYVVRLSPDGILDRAFGAQTGLGADIFALAVQPDQKLLIGGSLVAQNPEPQRALLRTLVGDPTAPFFVTEPQDAVLPPGSDLLLFGEAAGARVLTYHWERNGQAIPGATTPPLILRQLTESDSGSYVLWVSNTFGVRTSRPARVDILPPPTLIEVPTPQTVIAGISVTLQVTASGGEPLAFEWKRDNVRLRHATNAILALRSVTTNDAGNYVVQVSNRLTQVSSPPARLTVVEPPRVLSPPLDQRVLAGQAAAFTVIAAGTRPVALQWTKDDRAIPGGTSDYLEFPATQPSDAGRYRVVITNAYGAITSAPALLEVLVPPVITRAPAGIAVAPGDDATLSVEAAGTPPLFYQWAFNNLELPGANASTLTLKNVNEWAAGDYFVIVGSPAGIVASPPARITIVQTPPALTDLRLAIDEQGAFRLTATAEPGFYQIETSDNLHQWTLAWSGRITNGRLAYTDPEAPFLRSRFFRIRGGP
ncbi:MAG: immunoglobulin domain-containing protein [Verrucomicrobiales bacterium]|nr:immunoglobulin domain-containing protein [Verrucomicrobiales bacterium]